MMLDLGMDCVRQAGVGSAAFGQGKLTVALARALSESSWRAGIFGAG